MKTMAEIMEQQDPETFAMMQKIMALPGMYLGGSNFKYMDMFLFGHAFARTSRPSSFCPMPNRPLQHWLLHTQSASLRVCTLNGQSLFYRMFGSRELAFENYKDFLKACLPEDPEEVSFALTDYENEHDIERHYFEEAPPGYNEQLANNALGEITGMIIRAGIAYDSLRVYVRRDDYFLQVRFLFHTADGWVDDTELIAKEENYTVLLAIHANARNSSAEAFRACGCDVNNKAKRRSSLDFAGMITNKTAFLSEYRKWKESVTGQGAAVL